MLDTAEELYGVLDAEERMRRAVDRAVLVTGAEIGILLTSDAGGVPLPRVGRDKHGHNLPLDVTYSRASVREVWETGRPKKVTGWEAPAHVTPTMVDQDLRSVMATRLEYKGQPQGVLYVHASYETPDFTDHDFRAFLGLAGLIATAIENARLEEESGERRKLAHQVKQAREVQERLQPSSLQTPEGFDMAGVGLACENLSGDYYDVIHRPDGTVALVMGDVSYHGVRPALHMATARAVVRRLTSENMPPASTLTAVSTVLAEDMAPPEFMTLFIGVLDPRGKALRWASAGQPALLRRKGGTLEELPATGPVLKFFPDVDYETRGPVALESGDVLLLFTDGLYEALAPDGSRWGLEALYASLDRHAGAAADAEGVLAGLLADVDDFRLPEPLSDDITCLVTRTL